MNSEPDDLAPVKGEILVETPHGVFVVRKSLKDGGYVAWNPDYTRLISHWLPPITLCEVKADLNAGIHKM